MSDGFLGRWSRRKLDAKEGRPLEPEPIPAPAAAPVAVAQPQAVPTVPVPVPAAEDARQLTPASNFRRFVQPDVPAPVRNAALKQLFADPRFNIQDGLDVYIDDYSRPDPLPESMLRQMASAKFLGLFREDEHKDATPAGPSEFTEELAGGSVAQSDASASPPHAASPAPAPSAPDAHADLRLQQDDATPGRPPGGGTG